jgi:hypothetical protein
VLKILHSVMNENDGVLYQSLDAKESSLEIRSGRTVSILKIICFVSWCISVNLGLNVTFILVRHAAPHDPRLRSSYRSCLSLFPLGTSTIIFSRA